MIKILFFIENLTGGGAEKVLCDLVNHMDHSVFDITVQSVWPFPESTVTAPEVRCRSIFSARNQLSEMRFRIETALGLTYLFHLRDDYDIECAFLESGPTKVLARSSNKRSVKLAWVHCDLQSSVSDPASFVAKTEKWYRVYDKVICVSEIVKESFDRLFQHRFPTVVLHNYVNDEEIRQRSLLKIDQIKSGDRPLLLAVGTLYPPKNYPRLLRTSKRLKEDGIDHMLWIVGDGVQRQMLEKYVSENDLSDCVCFMGFQTNPYPYFRLADLVVCSSNYEGFSTVVTEALILGKPVVTTDCAGMDELLGDSEYGLITENDDEAFYQGLKRMLSDREMLDAFRMKAKNRGGMFCGSEIIAQTERFLKEMAGDRGHTEGEMS